ncbi:hypothetical protein V9T40_005887 [Parthenolecanium corni]|uniref:Uncharacterized protein n=1 Tax=Parthenolecanium corni TaxID=536013 RepID=A0AAN9YA10_9HEMI
MRTATTSNLRQPPVLCERENGARGKFGSSWCSVAPPPPLPPWLGRAGSVWVLARNGDGVASAWLRCLRWAPASWPLRLSFGGRSGPLPLRNPFNANWPSCGSGRVVVSMVVRLKCVFAGFCVLV